MNLYKHLQKQRRGTGRLIEPVRDTEQRKIKARRRRPQRSIEEVERDLAWAFAQYETTEGPEQAEWSTEIGKLERERDQLIDDDDV